MATFLYIAVLGIAIHLACAVVAHAADKDEEAVASLNGEGVRQFRLGDYKKAKECFERSIAIQIKSQDSEHPDVVWSLNNLGVVYCNLGDYAKAKECHERVLAMIEKLLGEKHPGVAESLNGLGMVYSRLGDYAKSEECFERSLAIQIKSQNTEHLNVAWTLNSLGVVYSKLCDYAKSEVCFESALAMIEKLLGEKHPDVARSLSSLGGVYTKLGDYAKSKVCHRRTISTHEGLQEVEHIDVAKFFNCLGVVYNNLGDHAKAKECFERALVMFGKLQHPDVAESLDNLGRAYCNLGDYSKAKERHVYALSMREKLLGSEHLDVAESLDNLGWIYNNLCDYAKAKECHERVLSMREKLLGNEHLDVAASLNSLGGVYNNFGDYAKSKEYHERALVMREKLLGKEHTDVALSLNNLGIAYTNLGDYAKATECLERALLALMKSLGGGHPYVAHFLNSLGSVCQDAGAKNQAIFYKKLGVNILQSVRHTLMGFDKGLRKSFAWTKEFHYRSLADLLAGQGRIPEAQQVLAMLKEEEYFDFIRRDVGNDPRVSVVSYAGLEMEKAGQFKEIGENLFGLTREKEELLRRKKSMPSSEWGASEGAERLSGIENDLRLAGEAFQSFLSALEKEFKEASNTDRMMELAGMNLKSVRGLSGTLKKMGHGSVLIHTVIAETCVWVILTTPEVQLAAKYPIPKEDLFKKILDFRERLENRGDALPTAKELYGILIAPIEEDLKEAGARTLMFSLDGQLRYVPMAALHDGEKWLAEKYTVAVYTEAARDKLIFERDAPRWRAAAMGTTEEHPGFAALPAVREIGRAHV
jgi:tetratricopeptide (TPR) repeat protein